MRKLVVAIWLAASSIAVAVPAAADSPVSLPPLAPGEVLLEVNAVGVATTPATSATITVHVSAEGESEEVARRGATAAVARVTAAARAGIAASDIETREVGLQAMYDTAYNSMEVDVMNAADSAAFVSSHMASSAIVVRTRNIARVAALVETLSALERVRSATPEYALDDDSEARRAARADAVRRARADAEGYAASMNMRVARVLRVTERAGTDFMSLMIDPANREVMAQIGGLNPEAQSAQIRTYAIVGLDYALAPR